VLICAGGFESGKLSKKVKDLPAVCSVNKSCIRCRQRAARQRKLALNRGLSMSSQTPFYCVILYSNCLFPSCQCVIYHVDLQMHMLVCVYVQGIQTSWRSWACSKTKATSTMFKSCAQEETCSGACFCLSRVVWCT